LRQLAQRPLSEGLAVPLENLQVELVFVPEGRVDAGSADAQVINQILHRRGLVPPPPEQLQGGFQGRVK
jgi:hypothetical protein